MSTIAVHDLQIDICVIFIDLQICMLYSASAVDFKFAEQAQGVDTIGTFGLLAIELYDPTAACKQYSESLDL